MLQVINTPPTTNTTSIGNEMVNNTYPATVNNIYPAAVNTFPVLAKPEMVVQLPAALLPLRPYQHGDPIKMLCMNTAFLPTLASKITSGATKLEAEKARLVEFVQTFNEEQYDIICLQEMFNIKMLKRLFTCLNATEAKTNRVYMMRNAQGQEIRYYFYAPSVLSKHHPSLKNGSGLVILSKFPIVRANHVPFKSLIGPDWFTHKGFIHVELSALGRPLHVATTHSQSNPDKYPLWWPWQIRWGALKPQVVDARTNHHQQMRLFMMKIKEQMGVQGVTPNFFLCGDFNVRYGTQEYAHMKSILGDPYDVLQEMRPNENNWTMLTPGREKRLDYIFSYHPYHSQENPYDRERIEIVNCNVSDFHTPHDLSDHKGIEMVMRFVDQ